MIEELEVLKNLATGVGGVKPKTLVNRDFPSRIFIGMIQFQHVAKRYAPGLRALDDINIEIHKGELVLLSGANGAGKSTLLKLVYREEEPSSGKILVEGRNLKSLRWPGCGATAAPSRTGLPRVQAIGEFDRVGKYRPRRGNCWHDEKSRPGEGRAVVGRAWLGLSLSC